MKKSSLLLLSLLFTVITAWADGGHVIAHRGYWNVEGAAENSRQSVENAMKQGFYGAEIDVWQTTDGRLFVHHDSKIDGVKIESVKSKAIRDKHIGNGERLPQLKDILRVVKENPAGGKLIIEIKPHSTPERSIACTRDVIKLVNKRGLASRAEYISFSLDACKAVVQYAPGASVSYLSGDKTPTELHAMGINGIDYHIDVFRKHPEWVKEAHQLGMTVNVWTVNDVKAMEEMKKLGVDYITTNEPVLCEKIWH